MSITITDHDLLTILGQAKGPIEILSGDGKLLGRFTPQFPIGNISEEDLLQREQNINSKHYTSAEVEARLRELRCMPSCG